MSQVPLAAIRLAQARRLGNGTCCHSVTRNELHARSEFNTNTSRARQIEKGPKGRVSLQRESCGEMNGRTIFSGKKDGARERTRTSTSLRTLEPESSASASSA